MSTEGNIINAFLDDEVITNYKYRWDTLLFWTLNIAFLSDNLMKLKTICQTIYSTEQNF